jgi:hypothetical protein
MSRKKWELPTARQMFDNAVLGIASQGYRRAFSLYEGYCVALTHDGKRCALGWSCTDVKPGYSTTPSGRVSMRPY